MRTKTAMPRAHLSLAACLAATFAVGSALAQQAADDEPSTAPPADAAPAADALVPSPPPRPQVPFRSEMDEVVVYGRRDSLDLPDSIRTEIWRDERRQMQAMLLERERLSNAIARDGFDALFGGKLAVLPSYDPSKERQIDYGVNDSTPAGVINLFGVGFGRKKD